MLLPLLDRHILLLTSYLFFKAQLRCHLFLRYALHGLYLPHSTSKVFFWLLLQALHGRVFSAHFPWVVSSIPVALTTPSTPALKPVIPASSLQSSGPPLQPPSNSSA